QPPSSVIHSTNTIFLPDNTDLIGCPNKPAEYLALWEQLDLQTFTQFSYAGIVNYVKSAAHVLNSIYRVDVSSMSYSKNLVTQLILLLCAKS
ncbi:MAG: hypothetical protein NWQ42_09565, partial [Alishewanella sp.]|nr:hypothetical protein [Alishewanella sp.]